MYLYNDVYICSRVIGLDGQCPCLTPRICLGTWHSPCIQALKSLWNITNSGVWTYNISYNWWQDKGIGHWRFSCVMSFPWRPILSGFFKTSPLNQLHPSSVFWLCSPSCFDFLSYWLHGVLFRCSIRKSLQVLTFCSQFDFKLHNLYPQLTFYRLQACRALECS